MGRRAFNPLEILLQSGSEVWHTRDVALRVASFQPPVDVYETPTVLLVIMELPGVRPERIRITLPADGRTLTVSGDRDACFDEISDRVRCCQLEIFVGTFERQVALPDYVQFDRDAVSATYKDGLLAITLPKSAARAGAPHRVDILDPE